jgi:hypothetical protein
MKMNTTIYSADAAFIQNEIVSRRITRLCHFTTFDNAVSIFKMGALYSQKTLREEGVAFDIQDFSRFEGNGYINLSIQEPNFKLWTSFAAKDPSKEWCVLRIHPRTCQRQGTVFTTANAASNFVCVYGRGSGASGFRALFAESVAETHGFVQRNVNKPASIPTSSQAEVLCPEPLSIGEVLQVVVLTYGMKKRLMESGVPASHIVIDSWSFPKILRDQTTSADLIDYSMPLL